MDGYNPYYPYGYSTPTPMPQPKPQQERIAMVANREAINLLPMAPDSQKFVLNQAGNPLYLVTTDSAGYKTITEYDIFDRKAQQEQQQASMFDEINRRLQRLEAFVNEFNTPAPQSEQPKPYNGNKNKQRPE